MTQVGSGSLGWGGAIMETSGGTKYCVFAAYDGSELRIYKNLDGTPSQAGTATSTDVHGTSLNIGGVGACIDDNDDIWVFSACYVTDTRDIAYRKFDTGTDSWEGSGWAEAYAYAEAGYDPTKPWINAAVDSSGYPHIIFCDVLKYHGGQDDFIAYGYWNGSSWSSKETVRHQNAYGYYFPDIALCPNDDVEASWMDENYGLEYCRRNDTWGSVNLYATIGNSPWPGGITVTTGDTVTRYCKVDNIDKVWDNGVDIGATDVSEFYDKLSCSGALVDGTDYVFYIGTGMEIKYYYDTGSGWTSGGTLVDENTYFVIAQWSYNCNNQSGEINVIHATTGYVYYNSLTLAAVDSVAPLAGQLRKRRFQPLLVRFELWDECIARFLRRLPFPLHKTFSRSMRLRTLWLWCTGLFCRNRAMRATAKASNCPS